MEKQDLSKLQLRKVKAFKRKGTSMKEDKNNKKMKINDQ